MNTTTFIVLKPPRPEDSPGVKATAKKKGVKTKKIADRAVHPGKVLNEKVGPVQIGNLVSTSTSFKEFISKEISLNTDGEFADLQQNNPKLSESGVVSLVEKLDEMSPGPGIQEVTNGSIRSELEKDTSKLNGVESARSVNCEIKKVIK